jgi:hypothetical protein
MDILQVGLLAGLSLSLVLNVIILLWLLLSDRRQQGKTSLRHNTVHLDGTKFFATLDETEIRRLVQEKLEASAVKAAERFESSLNKAIPKLVADIDEMNSRTLRKEFEKHQVSFEALSEQALQAQARLEHDVTERRTALLSALDKKIVQEYQARLSKFDTRFSDVVASYITESLGKEADLGAQMPYILQQLEQNKEQLKQDILA